MREACQAEREKAREEMRVILDTNDDFLLTLTETGQANLPVTGDKAHPLPLRRHKAPRIVNVREALEILGG